MLRRLIAFILLGFALAGCNTMAGMGQDIERGGEELSEEARETQSNL